MEQLLKILEDNARMSVEDIAAMLNKSPAEVAKRLSPLDDVLSTATHFVLRTYKKEGRLYQDEEIDERECTVL